MDSREKIAKCNEDMAAFNKKFKELLAQDTYIARSNYKSLICDFSDTYNEFSTLFSLDQLDNYCNDNNISIEDADNFLDRFGELSNLKEGSKTVKFHNEQFLQRRLREEKEYLDNLLKESDTNVVLDENQRRVILSDEDYTLVIAGAGAGKTTTIEAKVKYLVEKHTPKIKPEEILVISFTNKAVEELKERIIQRLHIPCRVCTFHSIGYTISNSDIENRRIPVTDKYLYYKINEYLKKYILSKKDKVAEIIDFFAMYIDAPYSEEDLKAVFEYISNADFKTLKSYIGEYKVEFVDKISHTKKTINNEVVRSFDEVRIANFLYLNSIDYEYEKIFPFNFKKSKRQYTPDFFVKQGDKECWIEHFGMINEDNTSGILDTKSIYKYVKAKEDKIALHKKSNQDLICTYHAYSDGIDFVEHLKQELMKRGFVFQKKNQDEVYQKIVDCCETKYIDKFVKLTAAFISNFKSCGYDERKFKEFAESNKNNVRNKIFLSICESCYNYYQNCLREEHKMDFEDMINESTRVLDHLDVYKSNLKYKYIFIDEYQDISMQRFNFTKELSNVCDAKIIAVGDDWQSIYAFSGSNIDCFLEFEDKMGYCNELKIENTYRNSQELIDIAGDFIQKNPRQKKKTLKSLKRLDKPLVIESYKDTYDSRDKIKDKNYYLGIVVDRILGEIIENNIKDNVSKNKVLLIGRFGFDGSQLGRNSDLFEYDDTKGKIKSKKYPFLDLAYLTAHSSKGLGYDNVIIINAKNEIYGFPSQKEMDPIMKMVTKTDNGIDDAEERRLFYVALTRTKNRIYIAAPQSRPSKFVIELISNYPNIEKVGEINMEQYENMSQRIKHICPVCGFPLQKQWNKNYGLELYICTNEPELCGFITNKPECKTLQIHKCDYCQDGYLIVKHKEEYFLGCTNYNTIGCRRTISENKYKDWLDSKTVFNKKFAASIDLSKALNLSKNLNKNNES